MSGADEEWVKAAMTDDAMVVELLVRLHSAPPRTPLPRLPAAFPLKWSVRQRRSKSVSVNNNPKKPAYRASPTTPLSCCGANSVSGGSAGAGGVGSEESSRPATFKVSSTARSKVNSSNEKTTSKRSRKKKTLAELKDEENSLVKERRELKRELAALRKNLERQRTTNEKLKRMKIDLQPRSDAEESTSDQLQQELPVVPGSDVTLQSSTSNAHLEENVDAASDSNFILPDLNIPFDEPSSDVTCGVS